MSNIEMKGPNPSFGYNRFADLFYYLLAHIPLNNAADQYDPEYVTEMKATLGISPEIPGEVIDYYAAHFDRVMIVNFIALMVPDAWTFKGMLTNCGMLTEEDVTAFVDPLIGVCDRIGERFNSWWDVRHAENVKQHAEKVYESFCNLTERFGSFFDHLGIQTKVLFSHTLRNNGRAFNQPGMIVVYLAFPEKSEEIMGCFLQFLHECTHTITDPMMNRNILMSDGSHDFAEYQVLCFDEDLIAEICPELSETYREWVGPQSLSEARKKLGDEGEKRLKERLKEIVKSDEGRS